ncbi:MAG: hypothetical protein AAFY71_07805 [Bacteroidota bacterium]
MKSKDLLIVGAGLVLGNWALSLFGDDLLEVSEKAFRQRANQGQRTTHPDYTIEAFADQIHESLRYSMVADNKDRAESLLKMMNNDMDVLALITAYGRRQLRMFGLPDGNKKNLPETIASELWANQIARVNKLYEERGIQHRW